MLSARLFGALMLGSLSSAAATADQAPPPLEAYGDLSSLEDAAISPDGKSLAVAGIINGERQVVVTAVGSSVRAIAGLGAAKMHSLSFAGDDNAYFVTSTTKPIGEMHSVAKAEWFGALLLPLTAGRKVDAVFGRSSSQVDAIFGEYGTRLIDGKWYAFFGGYDMGRTDGVGLYRVDVTTNEAQIVASGKINNSRDWLVDGAGQVAAVLEMDGSGNWKVSTGRGQELVRGVDTLGAVSLIAIGAQGTSAIYSVTDRSDPGAPRTRWMEVPLQPGSAPREVFAGIDIARTFIDPANGRILGYIDARESQRPVLFDASRQAVFRNVYKAFGRQRITIMDWTPHLSHFVVSTSGSSNSGTVYLVDIAAKRADTVGFERPAIVAAQVGPMSTFVYKAGDGLDLDGVLTLPPGREPKNLPVVILPHGGPHEHDEAQFDWWAQAFASRGYAVLQPNFRGSTNRDDAFMTAGYGQWGRKMQTDLSDGLAALAEAGIADPKRACIVGASYGGYAALSGVTLQRGIYRCAVSVAGVSDLLDLDREKFRRSGYSRMTRANWRETLGPASGFGEVSPRRHAKDASAPILLIHGPNDTVVNIRHSTAMADALNDAKKPYEFIRLDGEDHWLTRAATRKQMLSAAVKFVVRNNPPG